MPEATVPTPTPENVLSNIATAELQVVLQPVNKFLTDLQQPGVNYQAVLQDFAALQLSVLSDAPVLQSVGISNIAAALQTALNNWVVSVTPAPAPAPTSAPAPAAA